MRHILRSLALAVMLAVCAAVPAWANATPYSLTTAWTKIASAGQTVEVQNQGGAVYLLTSASAPSGSTPQGEVLPAVDHRFYTLSLDLYAAAVSTSTVSVMTGVTAAADPNNASYTAAGAAVASGPLPLPAGVTLPRGALAYCTGPGGTTTLTLAGGGSVPWAVGQGAQDTGKAATAATAVTGCTFQALN